MLTILGVETKAQRGKCLPQSVRILGRTRHNPHRSGSNLRQHSVAWQNPNSHLADNLEKGSTLTSPLAIWPFKQHGQAENQLLAPFYIFFLVSFLNFQFDVFPRERYHAVLPSMTVERSWGLLQSFINSTNSNGQSGDSKQKETLSHRGKKLGSPFHRGFP